MARVREPRGRASLIQGFGAFASRKELDFADLLQKAGIDVADLAEPDNELSLNAIARLLTIASEQSNDPCLGIHWAEAFSPGASGILGYLILNAASVRKAVAAVARYIGLVMTPLEVTFEEEDGIGRLAVRFPSEFTAPRIQFVSFAMALLIIRLRKHAGQNWMPVRVDLEHRVLPCRESVLRVLGPNVHFDMPVSALHIRELVLERGSADADQRLFELIRQLGERMLDEQAPGADIVEATRKAIVKQLESGAVRVRDVAETLGIGASTLQSRLGAADTTYEEVLLSTRRRLSDLYLRDTDLQLTEIAFLLGFSELSAFTRAAQRWYGAPPSHRRAELRG